ncbi:MAG TPA: hypothetical protein VGY54_10980, partial [Polyangiaceae bacterium]|nr:hypothetical protein [Polyangiaceae bacterium]
MLCAGCSQPRSLVPRRESHGHQTPDRATVRAQLAHHRALQIARLTGYAQRAEFPHNFDNPTSAHVFRDTAGRLCAVANLVHQDGRDDLVNATVREHNDLAIRDVNDGPMLDWILASGLTQEELERIQLPAPPLARRENRRPDPRLVADNLSDEARMNQMVVKHIEQVRRELEANTEESLDTATDRFVTLPAIAARLYRASTSS